jgi:hypothetical protein
MFGDPADPAAATGAYSMARPLRLRQFRNAAHDADRRTTHAGRRADGGHQSRGARRQPSSVGNPGAMHDQQGRPESEWAAVQQLARREDPPALARRHHGVGDRLRARLRDHHLRRQRRRHHPDCRRRRSRDLADPADHERRQHYVVQSLGDCQATNVFVIDAGCAGLDTNVCSGDWPAFRHSGWRDGQQTMPSALTDPDEVRKLKQVWTFTAPAAVMPIAFRASPIVFQGRVFVGNGNGRLYALNAATGALLWEYPPPPAQALVSEYSQVNPSYTNPSGLGLAASATIAMDANERPMVVFGAPDPSLGAKMGSGRLFALDPASGAAIWKSPEIAVVNGLTSSITNEAVAITQRHEQFGYSSPLALGNLIYVGITDHADDPIQNGRVVAVNMGSGLIDAAFTFDSTSTRGGDVWSSVAGGLDKNVIVTTTGNSAN